MIGEVVTAEVTRVEAYGIYFRGPNATEIIVLIPDVSTERIKNLNDYCSVGDLRRVRILKYVSEKKIFKGIIKDVDQAETNKGNK